jgi:hypothetical protein
MRKKNLHPHQGNGTGILYLGSIEAYQKAFMVEHEKVKSWRIVAEPYGIYPNMARLIANGYDPGNRIRDKLRLPDKQAVEVCLNCGKVHTTKRCTSGNHRPRPPRIAIRLDDVESAWKTILNNMDSLLLKYLKVSRFYCLLAGYFFGALAAVLSMEFVVR